jgi:thiol-disulfide isomerase/thioredoxin
MGFVVAMLAAPSCQRGGGVAGAMAERAETGEAIIAKGSPDQKAIVEVAHGGEIDIMEYVVPGKTTVVDFFSPYCPPCMELKPKLERLAEARDGVNLVLVNINRPEREGSIDFASPVAKQYGIRSVPHVAVYGVEGELLGEGEEAYALLDQLAAGAAP